MPLLSAEPSVTRSSRSAVVESSWSAGTTRLTRPQSSAVLASITSPDMAISTARFLPTFLATATIGVWQNQPTLPPGVAKPAFSLATARSQVATSWQPAAVASPCTRATLLSAMTLRTGINAWSAQTLNFGPQLGFNWSPGLFKSKLVVRGGFGLNYNGEQIANANTYDGNPPGTSSVPGSSKGPTEINPNIIYAVSSSPTNNFGYPANK